MPPAIAAAIVSAIGLTGLAATIATAVIELAVTIGLSFIAQAVFGPKPPKPSDGQRTIRVAVGSRIRHYGKVRVGGQQTFYESRNGTLYALLTTGQGRINAIAQYLLNAKVVTVGGGGAVTSKPFGADYPIHLYSRLGTDDQTAYSELSAIFTEWTTNHRQRGCSSILMTCATIKADSFGDVYEGSREPEVTITIESSLIYDPRLDSTTVIGTDGSGDPIYGSGSHRQDDPDTWEYSNNWALCFADYLQHPDGYGLGFAAINWANIAGEADICDEAVTTVDARTIARWRVAGSYRLAEDERRTVAKEFLKAGDGFMWQDADGLVNIRCGRWIAPTVHIPEKHIIGCTASLGADPQDRANEVRVIYMEPGLDYTETESAPMVNAAARVALGRSEVSRFDCYYCPDHNQAQRIGKRLLRRLGDRWTLTITTNLYGLNVIGERFITVTISELAITALTFEVTSIKIDPARLNVELGLLQVEEDDFSFDAAAEEGDPPTGSVSTTVAIVIEAMTGLALAAVNIDLSGATGVGIQASWDAPTRLDLVAQVQYRPSAGGDWLDMIVSQDDRVANTGIISTGFEYEVRGRFISIKGLVSAWSSSELITPSAETAPSTPTLFSATGGTGSADLTWRNPPEANFDHVAVYENSVDVFGSATATGDEFAGGLSADMAKTITLAAGTHYLWLVSVSASSLTSSPTASQGVTVS